MLGSEWNESNDEYNADEAYPDHHDGRRPRPARWNVEVQRRPPIASQRAADWEADLGTATT